MTREERDKEKDAKFLVWAEKVKKQIEGGEADKDGEKGVPDWGKLERLMKDPVAKKEWGHGIGSGEPEVLVCPEIKGALPFSLPRLPLTDLLLSRRLERRGASVSSSSVRNGTDFTPTAHDNVELPRSRYWNPSPRPRPPPRRALRHPRGADEAHARLGQGH